MNEINQITQKNFSKAKMEVYQQHQQTKKTTGMIGKRVLHGPNDNHCAGDEHLLLKSNTSKLLKELVELVWLIGCFRKIER